MVSLLCSIPANIYLFKVDKKSTRKRYEICSKLKQCTILAILSCLFYTPFLPNVYIQSLYVISFCFSSHTSYSVVARYCIIVIILFIVIAIILLLLLLLLLLLPSSSSLLLLLLLLLSFLFCT